MNESTSTAPELEKPLFVIDEMCPEDVEQATEMRLQSWLDTYVSDEAGVTREWLEARNQEQSSDERKQARMERFTKGKAAGTFNAWVARDSDGKIIGSTTPRRDEEGKWRLGSLYVAKEYLGTGVGGQLMKTAMDWMGEDEDIFLGVVSYNERAKAFYRKWGFEEIPGSDTLYDGKIPEVMMVRKTKSESEEKE